MTRRLQHTSFVVAIVAALILTGCGTTSGLQGARGGALTQTRKFSSVTVQDFKVSVSEHQDEARSAGASFADLIASEIRKAGRFSKIMRNAQPDANTLVISGTVTKYDEGSTQKRIWLGMGFGMSFLEANVNFRDSKGSEIGVIKVDKNSWPLGGAFAAGQNPHSFMNGAADKIAEEAAKLAR
ncbi:MAG: hypothetical protein QOG67_76 [Verrucomicrobiota bacterium]|jgi:hypothetical protein